MMQFESIGSFLGSGYAKTASLVNGSLASFVDSIGVLDGGPPGIRTLNLRIKRCPNTLGDIRNSHCTKVLYVPRALTAPRVGSLIGSGGSEADLCRAERAHVLHGAGLPDTMAITFGSTTCLQRCSGDDAILANVDLVLGFNRIRRWRSRLSVCMRYACIWRLFLVFANAHQG